MKVNKALSWLKYDKKKQSLFYAKCKVNQQLRKLKEVFIKEVKEILNDK